MGTLVRRDGKHRQKHHLRSAYPILEVCGNVGLECRAYRLFTDLGTGRLEFGFAQAATAGHRGDG